MISILTASERQGVFAPPFEAKRAPAPSKDLVPHEELIALSKRAGVRVLVDMASDLPPWDQIRRFQKAGADLMVLSGGKAIGGPQSSGLLFGRRDLIEAARLNSICVICGSFSFGLQSEIRNPKSEIPIPTPAVYSD